MKKDQIKIEQKIINASCLKFILRDGSGFLYYWTNTFNYEGDDIIVGSGSSGRISNASTFHPNKQQLNQRIRKKIENRILGIH